MREHVPFLSLVGPQDLPELWEALELLVPPGQCRTMGTLGEQLSWHTLRPRMGLNEKIQFANRKAVGAGGKRQLVVQPPSEKNAEERQLMEQALKKNEPWQRKHGRLDEFSHMQKRIVHKGKVG